MLRVTLNRASCKWRLGIENTKQNKKKSNNYNNEIFVNNVDS